jgi:hypothetical protein
LDIKFRNIEYLQVRYPERITLIRGNHESRQITQVGAVVGGCIGCVGVILKSCAAGEAEDGPLIDLASTAIASHPHTHNTSSAPHLGCSTDNCCIHTRATCPPITASYHTSPTFDLKHLF